MGLSVDGSAFAFQRENLLYRMGDHSRSEEGDKT